MFNLFKMKNKIKELEMRVLVLESNMTKLNAPQEFKIDFSKVWSEAFTPNGYIVKGAKLQCENCNKEVNTMKATISDLVATQADIDDLKFDKTDISNIEKIKSGAINVEKNSSFSTPTPWEPYREDSFRAIK